MSDHLLDIDRLVVDFPQGRRKAFHAVDDVSLYVGPHETLGLVGESGSGKSTIGSSIVGLAQPTKGTIRFGGEDITHAPFARRRALSADIQIIFQDPYSSLNPSRTVGQTLVEPLLVHKRSGRGNRMAVSEMLQKVGLEPSAADKYPPQFSGGQRQRIAVARALIVSPKLVVCDEAVSALDLSVQAQVLNLLLSLQHDLGLSYLFISHDLSVVRHISQRIVVLYGGRIMETGNSQAIYDNPGHPYSQALLAALPEPDPAVQKRRRRPPPPAQPGPALERGAVGCPFVERCPYAIPVCRTSTPELLPGPSGSLVACHRRDEIATLASTSSVTAAARNHLDPTPDLRTKK